MGAYYTSKYSGRCAPRRLTPLTHCRSLLKHNLAKPDGPYKEMYNVIGQWLRLLATAHQEDGPIVTALQQKWLNMFGRWPITIAFFVSSAPSASQPLLPPGKEPEGDEVPNGLRGEVFDAAMNFKRYLTDDARDPATAIIPMVPVLWEVRRFTLRHISCIAEKGYD